MKKTLFSFSIGIMVGAAVMFLSLKVGSGALRNADSTGRQKLIERLMTLRDQSAAKMVSNMIRMVRDDYVRRYPGKSYLLREALPESTKIKQVQNSIQEQIEAPYKNLSEDQLKQLIGCSESPVAVQVAAAFRKIMPEVQANMIIIENWTIDHYEHSGK